VPIAPDNEDTFIKPFDNRMALQVIEQKEALESRTFIPFEYDSFQTCFI
jgi:hypothetical protein